MGIAPLLLVRFALRAFNGALSWFEIENFYSSQLSRRFHNCFNEFLVHQRGSHIAIVGAVTAIVNPGQIIEVLK